jgi:hypothetical protein
MEQEMPLEQAMMMDPAPVAMVEPVAAMPPMDVPAPEMPEEPYPYASTASMMQMGAPGQPQALSPDPVPPLTVVSKAPPMEPMLGAPRAVNPSIMPAMMNAPSMPQTMAAGETMPMVRQAGGLYINPYPLQGRMEGTDPHTAYLDQAMMEKSRQLNPVQLGAGMTTGVKAQPANLVGGKEFLAKQSPVRMMGVSALTPMLDGEPAPLRTSAAAAPAALVERQPMRQYAQAVGFGSDLPLALAISQVVPSDFTHRFEGNVDTSKTVTWEGGKPWNVVLSDMLRPEGLEADIDGSVVVISKM